MHLEIGSKCTLKLIQMYAMIESIFSFGIWFHRRKTSYINTEWLIRFSFRRERTLYFLLNRWIWLLSKQNDLLLPFNFRPKVTELAVSVGKLRGHATGHPHQYSRERLVRKNEFHGSTESPEVGQQRKNTGQRTEYGPWPWRLSLHRRQIRCTLVYAAATGVCVFCRCHG